MDFSDVEFSKERFEVLSGYRAGHFWFDARQALILRILERFSQGRESLAVDVGCGPGLWLNSWLRFAKRVVGVDPYADVVGRQMLEPGVEMVAGTTASLPVEDGQADLVLALDVLEHVNDVEALKEITRILRPGALLVVSVPAMPWLWSYRDEAANHLRRYTRSSLLKLVSGAGLEVCHAQYFQGLLMPMVIASRVLGRRSAAQRDREDHPPKWLNTVLRQINLFEVKTGLCLPFGSSLVLLARKHPQ